MSISEEAWQTCIDVLQAVAHTPELADDNPRFKALVAKVSKAAKRRNKQANAQTIREHDTALLDQTIRKQMDAAEQAVFTADDASTQPLGHKIKAQHCYICYQPYHEIDYFYHRLCPSCAALSHEKRQQRVDLTGRTAVVTGGRVKIGYMTALRLLRDGARVIVTSRYPKDALQRFAQEDDYTEFAERLVCHGLDFRHIAGVQILIDHLKQHEPAIDILINNAAQSIRRPPAFYAALNQQEQMALPPHISASNLGEYFSKPTEPLDALTLNDLQALERDMYGQALDLSPNNSWRETLLTVDTVEFMETQVINSFAPFMLIKGLKPLFDNADHALKFIVNATGVDGLFVGEINTAMHPHVNMSKAALNMLSFTSAQELADDNILMNSVDTGWVSDDCPYDLVQARKAKGFVVPLDLVDGASRLYDPIVQGIQHQQRLFGKLFKNYQAFEFSLTPDPSE